MVPGLSTQGEEKDTERAGVHDTVPEEQDVQFSGVQRSQDCLQEVKCGSLGFPWSFI